MYGFLIEYALTNKKGEKHLHHKREIEVHSGTKIF